MKILILLLPANICYSVERSMEYDFGAALEKLGVSVSYLDTENFSGAELLSLSHQSFDALFSFETSFYHSLVDGYNIRYGDLFECPKFYFSLDHPQTLYNINQNSPQNMYILTHDRNYVKYIKTYYTRFKDSFLMNPAGKEVFYEGKKIYDISFMGSFPDPDRYIDKFSSLDSYLCPIAELFCTELSIHPESTDDENLLNTLKKLGLELSNDQFAAIMSILAFVPDMVMAIYRKNMILSLLQSGLTVDVWGDSWNNFPNKEKYNLIIHQSLPYNESILEIAKSKFSLNIMSGHKDGYTERIGNSALNRAVIISNKTGQLVDKYENGKEIIFFDIDRLNDIPEKILAAMPFYNTIAEKAYIKASVTDTWLSKASEFVKIIENLP